ncbi:penicillin-binding protein 1C [Rhodovulum adriaticum]|uniref:peptidoglycan glycosyltransferase n=1 Tax=Rhodovulum adriaticum TaxID=35804 RepID=A0A4R2NZR7_RHOAD|nr:penicillin-binding protein 1C [Rhodovulum adriaticum]MBK1634182.1 penicillin-binding protein 1C [Rhodovulum adriaticum]TCP27268.1 penicillin-binding protein 1C [Rhodovulum adriaticum]
MRRLLPLLVAALFLGAAGRDAADRWIAATALPPLAADASIEVLDRHARLLRAYTVADGRWRLATSPDAVAPLYLRMLIAYEDKRFHAHPGIDLLALTRAAGQAARQGRIVSGGSTLTMQVARLLEDGTTGQLPGKLRQMRVALALERRLDKTQILGLYLDRAPFGGNLEGVRAASYAWFGKPPRRLTPAEAALLVALPQSPETRRPDRHPAAARAARDRVLVRMQRAGVLSAEQVTTAARAPIPTMRRSFPALAAHLSDRARAQAPMAPLHHLTLDADLQSRLETLLRDTVRPHGAPLTAALIVANHRSGAILAHIGSPDFTDTARGGFNDMTAAARSPGSTLKPLVYGLAFAQGLAHPETLLEDRPTAFGAYRPANFDGLFGGTMTARTALQASRNIPVVALAQALGPDRLMVHLRRAGARPKLPQGVPGLAVALGGLGLTLEDLTRLYAAIANGGQAVPLHWRQGAGPAPATAPVLTPEAAWQVADILRGVPAPPAAAQGRVAFKTGTSYGHRDAWAVGFDGAHVVAVWLGRADGTPVPGAFGADLAAPLLFQVFQRIAPVRTPLPPPPPGTLIAANPDLPPPLRRFATRGAAAPGGPRIAFPPDGAVLEDAADLPVKLEGGTPPFTLLGDGAPLATGLRMRQATLPVPGPGYLSLSVIDAEGRAARAAITLR